MANTHAGGIRPWHLWIAASAVVLIFVVPLVLSVFFGSGGACIADGTFFDVKSGQRMECEPGWR